MKGREGGGGEREVKGREGGKRREWKRMGKEEREEDKARQYMRGIGSEEVG